MTEDDAIVYVVDDDAADITGQVFVRLYQNLHTFRNEASFSAWLFRIVRNCYQDMCVRPLRDVLTTS